MIAAADAPWWAFLASGGFTVIAVLITLWFNARANRKREQREDRLRRESFDREDSRRWHDDVRSLAADYYRAGQTFEAQAKEFLAKERDDSSDIEDLMHAKMKLMFIAPSEIMLATDGYFSAMVAEAFRKTNPDLFGTESSLSAARLEFVNAVRCYLGHQPLAREFNASNTCQWLVGPETC